MIEANQINHINCLYDKSLRLDKNFIFIGQGRKFMHIILTNVLITVDPSRYTNIYLQIDYLQLGLSAFIH